MASLPMLSWPQEAAARSTPIPAPVPPAPETQARLSALEWSIVAMAERDGIGSLREPGRLAAALGNLFGIRRPNRLANDQLEALRRLAVMAWHHRWNVPKSELDQFLEAGFTLDQYELIQASIGQAFAQRSRRTAW
jgi:hypothetical protein